MAHILIVEDEPTNAEVAAVICQAAGHTVAFAAHGEEALALLAKERFDLALVDVQMPVMDGLALTRRIRAHPEWRHLPILAVTAKASAVDQGHMWEAGMSHVVTKPYRNSILRQAVEELLAQVDRGARETRVARATESAPAEPMSEAG